MGIEIEAGRIVCKNALGQTVLDTDEGQFVITDYVSGSVTLPSYSAQNRNFVDLSLASVDTYTDLADINADADLVRGSFLVTTSGGQGVLHNIGWFGASGTYTHFVGAGRGPFTPGNIGIMNLALYTFAAESGKLRIREQVKLAADYSTGSFTNTITLLAPTFQYKVFCGALI